MNVPKAVEQQYKKSEGSIPEFLDNSGIFPNERQHVTETKLGTLMLKSQVIELLGENLGYSY